VTTVPGFSSRSTSQHLQQFPQRDEAEMSAYDPEPGFSNTKGVDDGKPADGTEVKVIEPEQVEDKAVKSASTKRTARKKS